MRIKIYKNEQVEIGIWFYRFGVTCYLNIPNLFMCGNLVKLLKELAKGYILLERKKEDRDTN